ncbi:putative inner membrane protein [Salmonella enterica subsp. houtenae serovar 16:z4,z32:-- str. RKS3027]|nr:putative inner membrane protein [Salmonella enterica subsp. houtenae serovar 16:z4,z32:-- str. RKS3027]
MKIVINNVKSSANVWPESIKCVSEPPIHFTNLLTNSLLWKIPRPEKRLKNIKKTSIYSF